MTSVETWRWLSLPQWAVSPRFRGTGRSIFVNFKMEFELMSCKREKKMPLSIAKTTELSHLENTTQRTVCLLSRTFMDGVPDQSMKREGEKQIKHIAEERSN